MKPDNPGFTWSDGEKKERSRIDYMFASKNFCCCPENIYLRKPPSVSNVRFSDHTAIISKYVISTNSRGKGYWKLNTSILKYKDYCEMIIKLLMDLLDEINVIIMMYNS
jgi:hypothetical protein